MGTEQCAVILMKLCNAIWTGIVILVYGAALLVFIIFTIAIYRITLHQLASIPGPKPAAVTNLWQALYVRDGRMIELGRRLHQQFGPVVRVGPNELWFDSIEAFRSIYGTTHALEKSDFYLATSLPKPKVDWSLRVSFRDTLDLLSERDMKRYRLQRRLIGPVYHVNNVSRFQPAVEETIDKFITKLKLLQGTELDLAEWMHIITVECLAAVVLSWSPGMIKRGSDGGSGPYSYLAWRLKSVFGLFPMATKLGIRSKTFRRLFTTAFGVTYRLENLWTFFPDTQKKVVKRIKSEIQKNPRPRNACGDLIEDLVQLHKDKPEFTIDYLQRMAITNFGAGHDTLASTLTSAVSLICSDPRVKQKVVEEIRGVKGHPQETTYLMAAIQESRRLRPVLSMALQRVVPANGLQLDGTWIPSGITVGCHPYALHRNPEICGPEPDLFKPERWFDLERAKIMSKYSLAWGGGSRTCPGRHLAEMVVNNVIPALFREFDISVEVPPEREMPSYVLSMMTGVKARFHSTEIPLESAG